MLPLNRVYNFDSIASGLDLIDNRSVDMIFTDPPYNTTNAHWECAIDMQKMWTQFNRIIKDTGVIAIWAQAPFSHILATSNITNYRYEWVIEKTKATGHLNAKKMPLKAHENILIFYKKLPVYNPQMTDGHPPVNSYTKHTTDGELYGKTRPGISGGGSTQRYPRDVLSFAWDTQKSKLHNCQKPVAACKYFIETYTLPGMTVLDPFAGSCTTGVAAVETGRNFICMEKDEKIFQRGSIRTAQHKEDRRNDEKGTMAEII